MDLNNMQTANVVTMVTGKDDWEEGMAVLKARALLAYGGIQGCRDRCELAGIPANEEEDGEYVRSDDSVLFNAAIYYLQDEAAAGRIRLQS